MGTRTDTKQKMLAGAVELLRERGAAGVTIDAVLQRSGAPRGSVYHHFPGGRAEIMTESLLLAGDAIAAVIETAYARGSIEALRSFGAFWTTILHDSDYEAGCPVVSVAVGSSPEDRRLQPAAARIVERWHHALTAAIITDGVDDRRADSLATVAIATIEGAVMMCRLGKSTAPLDTAITELESLFSTIAPERTG